MRKIVAAVFVSLDGVMQAPGGPDEDTSGGFRWGGWTFHYFDEAAGAAMDELFREPYDLLLGRRTYDIFAAHWPHLEGDPLADQFNAVTKYVATHRPDSLGWRNTQWLGEDPITTLRRLKGEDGPTLLIQGSSLLIQSLLAADLIDSFRVMTFPLLLGAGKKLWGEGTLAGALSLTGSQTTPSGIVIASYARAGDIRTGSFALPDATS